MGRKRGEKVPALRERYRAKDYAGIFAEINREAKKVSQEEPPVRPPLSAEAAERQRAAFLEWRKKQKE